MSTFTVETACGTSREFDSMREAEEGRSTHASLCEECDSGSIRIVPAGRSDGGRPTPPAAPSATDATDGADAAEVAVGAGDASGLPEDLPDSVRTDPLDAVPGYMIDEVEGQPTINKRGYAVIANHFDIVVHAEPITTAGETDHEYAEFRARAWRKEDGPEHAYTGHATARTSESRRGIEDNLNEMAETRAMKRAVAWASGVGLLAWEEMTEYLED